MDYQYYGVDDTFPGHISYRKNDINVDCGCVFSESYPNYPVSLGAICLETLEEIYANDLEEVFSIEENDSELFKLVQEQRILSLKRKYDPSQSKYRMEMLQQLK